MKTFSTRNHRRTLVIIRYSRLHGVPLTLGVLTALAGRYDRKHSAKRTPNQPALPDEPTTPARPSPRTSFLVRLAGLVPADRPVVSSASSRRAAVPLTRGWLPWPP